MGLIGKVADSPFLPICRDQIDVRYDVPDQTGCRTDAGISLDDRLDIIRGPVAKPVSKWRIRDMPRPAFSTGRSILLLCVCGLSVGCGTLSHRTAARDDAELDALASTQDGDEVTTTPSRRPWRSPELEKNADSAAEQVALTSAEEAVDESRDPAAEIAPDPTTDAPATCERHAASALSKRLGRTVLIPKCSDPTGRYWWTSMPIGAVPASNSRPYLTSWRRTLRM